MSRQTVDSVQANSRGQSSSVSQENTLGPQYLGASSSTSSQPLLPSELTQQAPVFWVTQPSYSPQSASVAHSTGDWTHLPVSDSCTVLSHSPASGLQPFTQDSFSQ